MKSFDILFIFISALILTAINYFGSSEILGRFSLIIALIGYFVGKASKQREIKNS
jgi:hypothetical protein